MDLKGILFDLDETLVRQRDAVHEGLREAIVQCAPKLVEFADGIALTVRRTAKAIWKSYACWPWCERMGIDGAEALSWPLAGAGEDLAQARALLPRFRADVWSRALAQQVPEDQGLGEQLQEAYLRLHPSRRTPYADVVPVLDALRCRRLPLAIVSNGAADAQRSKLVGSDLDQYFDAVVISTEVRLAKPEPEIFRQALEELRIAPQNAIMVGDSAERDVVGAKRAGVRTALLNRRAAPTPVDVDPDWNLSSLDELLVLALPPT